MGSITMADLDLPHAIAGNVALDFANTISWRGTARAQDHFADGDAILRWAMANGLIDRAADIPAADRAALLHDAATLRDAIIAAFGALAARQEPPPAALDTVRRQAADGLARARVCAAPARIVFAGVDRILGTVAWAALDLLRGDQLDRLRQCPPDDCRWLFIDRTRNGSRRWCDMATCGNRAKKARR